MLEPLESCTFGGTERKLTQSEGVLGRRPIVDILYKAPDIARIFMATKVSFAVMRVAFSGPLILASSKRAKAAGKRQKSGAKHVRSKRRKTDGSVGD